MSNRYTNEYVRTLNKDLQDIYHKSYNLILNLPDTLEDDFQIAAAIVVTFNNMADKYNKLRGST